MATDPINSPRRTALDIFERRPDLLRHARELVTAPGVGMAADNVGGQRYAPPVRTAAPERAGTASLRAARPSSATEPDAESATPSWLSHPMLADVLREQASSRPRVDLQASALEGAEAEDARRFMRHGPVERSRALSSPIPSDDPDPMPTYVLQRPYLVPAALSQTPPSSESMAADEAAPEVDPNSPEALLGKISPEARAMLMRDLAGGRAEPSIRVQRDPKTGRVVSASNIEGAPGEAWSGNARGTYSEPAAVPFGDERDNRAAEARLSYEANTRDASPMAVEVARRSLRDPLWAERERERINLQGDLAREDARERTRQRTDPAEMERRFLAEQAEEMATRIDELVAAGRLTPEAAEQKRAQLDGLLGQRLAQLERGRAAERARKRTPSAFGSEEF